MGELEPGTRKRIGELIRIFIEATRDFFVDRIGLERDIGGQHSRRMTLRLVVSVRYAACAGVVFRLPLMRTSRALGQLPFVAEQVPEEVIAPLRWRRSPGDFEAAADRVGTLTGAV